MYLLSFLLLLACKLREAGIFLIVPEVYLTQSRNLSEHTQHLKNGGVQRLTRAQEMHCTLELMQAPRNEVTRGLNLTEETKQINGKLTTLFKKNQ